MAVQKVLLLNQTTPVVIPSGLVPKGAYNGATDYAVGDSVDYNGSSYVMYADAAAGTLPTDTTKWQVLANKGDTGAAGADGADSTVPGPAGADGLTVSVNSVTQVAGNISLTQDNIPDGTTNKAYTATEQSKLAGIEALADVTDAINVASAGAVMDGDFSANGVMTRTAAGTYTSRTITGTANQITVTNGDGVSGNPTLALPQDIHTGASPTFAGGTVTGNLIVNGFMVVGPNQYLNIKKVNYAKFTLENTGTPKIWAFENDSGSFAITDSTLAATRLKVDGTDGSTSFTGNAKPTTDSTYTLGTSSLYWKETYTDRLYLNSTAYLDGATAGALTVTGMLGLGSTPTHSITLNSTATGITLYNTTDQTTNYERVRAFWNSNIFNIYGEVTGSGSTRAIMLSALGVSTQGILLANSSASGFVQSRGTSSTAGAIVHSIDGTHNSSSGTQYGLRIATTLNQSSTAGYTALLINPTETATGSGTKLLADFQVGGTSKVSIKNDGVIFPVQAVTASAPTYVKGGIYFDTTLNKLRIGGATGWETVTSS